MIKNLSLTAAFVSAVLLLSTLAGWAKNYHLDSTKVVPSAMGGIDTNKDKNGNTVVDLKAEHLARPGMLTPPANAYVVWFQQQGSDPENEGQLAVGNDLKAQMKTTTPYHNFDIFITAESDPTTKTPSDLVVMRSKVAE